MIALKYAYIIPLLCLIISDLELLSPFIFNAIIGVISCMSAINACLIITLFVCCFSPPFCLLFNIISSIQSLSHVQLFVIPWTVACQASLSITNSQRLLKFMSIVLVIPSNHLILYHPLLLSPSIFPSIRVFSNESALHIKWSKYWSFSFTMNPSNEYSGLISFRKEWLGLLAVQGTLKNLLQHHSSAASNLQCSGFFIVQLSRP